VPVGRDQQDAPAERELRKRVGKTGRHKNAEPVFWPRTMHSDWFCRYAAALFAVFADAFAGCFGVAFFAVLAFSFATNSCLTVAVMAATSTL
jgi:hypothetical protein